jgi:hypothetical protein
VKIEHEKETAITYGEVAEGVWFIRSYEVGETYPTAYIQIKIGQKVLLLSDAWDIHPKDTFDDDADIVVLEPPPELVQKR